MGTTFGNFEEFWAAMGRLYDRQLKHDEQIAELGVKIAQLRDAQAATDQQMRRTDERLDRVAAMVATVAGAVAKQAQEIESHERRLERMEGQ